MSPTAGRPSAIAFAFLLSAVPAVAGPGDDRSVLQLRLESAKGAPGATQWVLRGPAGRDEALFLDVPVLDGRIVASAGVSNVCFE